LIMLGEAYKLHSSSLFSFSSCVGHSRMENWDRQWQITLKWTLNTYGLEMWVWLQWCNTSPR
jgi:hypothetical protein